jgi:hypothetical protein
VGGVEVFLPVRKVAAVAGFAVRHDDRRVALVAAVGHNRPVGVRRRGAAVVRQRAELDVEEQQESAGDARLEVGEQQPELPAVVEGR